MRAFSFKTYCLIALIFLYAGAAIGADYFWDTSTDSGYQSGNGTWGGGTYKYWTFKGGTLIAWPGAGNSATFTSGGASAITVDGTQGVDSMAFLSNGYTLNSGTINYGSKNGLLMTSGITATINSVIDGTGGLKIYATSTGEPTLNLNGANTYTGVTTIGQHIRLNVSIIANGGQNSGIGKSSSSASNLVVNGGILWHSGGAASTDRLFTLTENSGLIYASGSGALNFTNTGAIAFSGTGARSLEFGGGSAVSNSFSPVIGDQAAGSTTQIRKTGGTSIWTFTGENTYSGGTTITAGTLQIGNAGTTGSITGNVTNDGTLAFNRTNAYTFAGVISGSGVVKQAGTGTTSLSGTNTYSGGTTISSGTLQIGNGGTTGSITGNVTNNGTLTFNRANDYSFTGTISGTGTVTQNGSAVLTFSGASHTYSGTTTINGGTLAIGDGGSIYSSGTYAGTVVINDGGVFRMNRFDFWGGHTSKPSAMIMINEGGAMISNGYNNTLGPITLNGGSLVSDGGSQWGWDTWSLHGTVTVNGTVKSNITTTGGAYNEVKIGDCTEGGQTTFDVGNNAEGDDLEVSSVLRDDRGSSDPYPAVSSGLIKTGAGTMLLTGTNTYSGGTTISAGTLQIGNSGTTGSITGNVTDNATLVFKRSDAYTFGGVISGSGAVIQAGAGTLTLSGANTYSGLTTVNSVCTLIVAHNTALGNTTGGTSLSAGGIGRNRATALVISNGITVTGETVTLNSNITEDHRSALVVKNGSTATWNGTVTLAGDGSAQFYADGTMDLQGTINGSCASLYIRGNESTGIGNLNATVNIGSTKLLKTGEDGTWIINSTGNTWGSTQVAAGTLKLGVSNALPSATVVTIGENSTLNSTLDLNAKDQTIAGLTDGGSTGGTQKITNSGASPSTLTINNTSDYTYSYLIEDGTDKVNLVKSGTGTLTLAGTNTYTGTTNVSGGTLAVNGSTHSSSAVSVFAGATLAGSGTAAGSVTVANDGIIAPGNSAGTLSTGSLVLDNSSVLDFELGTSSDLIKVSGDLTLDGILNITETAGFGPGDYTIIEYTGVLTDNGLDVGTAPNNFSYEISINEGTKSVILTVLPGIKLNPVTVVEAAQVCSVYTDDWTIVFDNGAGGGITAMTDSVHGQSSGQGNQLSAGQNLYYFSYDGQNSKTSRNGTWSVLNKADFYAIIRQSGTLSGLPYITDYTIHGSGKIYIKTTLSNTGGDVSGKTVMCVAERRSVATMSALSGNSTASLSPYVLLSSNSAGHSDILLSIKDLWNTSNGAANSATGFYSNASSGYNGYQNSSLSIASGQKQVWEFMLDFMHDSWNDTSGVGGESDDYRSPDSLEMVAGTLLMEKSWEKHLRGHWKMDEGAGDTIRDNSGNKRHAKTTGTWASGRWSGALGLNGSQNATYPDNADFDGTDFFTVMAWVKTNSGAFTASSVVAGKINGSNGWKLTGNGSDQVVLTCNGTSVTGTREVGDGSWHHVAACFSPSMVVLYVDGHLDKISTGTYSVTANDNALVIGNGLTGTLDDVRYYHDYISENTLKAIYQQGFRSSEGFYELRADNNGSISLKIDGGSIRRNFPVFLIHNYWAEAKPKAGCVVLNGTSLTEGTDYQVHFDDQNNQLIVGLNKIISSDEACLYIDNDFEDGHMMSGETKKMSWGVQNAGSYNHFWVKNFSGTNFGGSTSNEWYLNWKMVNGTDNKSKDGEIWHMASSVKNPGIAADTTSTTNLIPGGDSWYSTMGNLNFKLGTAESKSSEDVTNAFTYAVEESSSVRVLLRVNERKVSDNLQFIVVTRWAVYPTGQFFRSDSIYQQEAVPSFCYFGLYMDDQTNASIYMNKYRMRAGVIYSSGLPDFATCWLSFKNDGGYQQYPFDNDTITSVKDNSRVGIDYYDGSPSALWNSLSIQTAYYFDMQKSDMSNGFVDSVANGVQFIGTGGGAALNVSTGTLLSGASAAAGDLNGDGFNEREGAYVIEASDNTVNFKIPARNDTCRFYPAFRLTKYYASTSPQYIFLYNSSGDTVPLLEGYQYNAWVNRIKRELVVQIDSIFCDSVGVFISADRTLAVTLSGFWARGGQNCDSIGWRTESEHENLGYNLYRRVKPSFYDSLSSLQGKRDAVDGAVTLLKEKALSGTDTGWVLLNDEIIPGAPSGVSQGSRDYKWIDKDVYNEVLYEYKLVSVDFKNATEEFGPVEAMPSGLSRIYHLGINFPNPFRRFTVIRFELPVECRVTLNIYNLQGRLVRRLITPDKPLRADSHQIMWDGKNDMGSQLEAGPYIYRINARRFTKSRVMIMLE